MSRHTQMEITCSECGAKAMVEVWQSLNIDTDPQMKESFRNKKMFTYDCPKCGKRTILNYPMLYHDMKNKAVVQYIPEEGMIDTAVEGFEQIFADGADGEKLRIVLTQNALIEKSIIFEAGLDDRLIELMKVVYVSNCDDELLNEVRDVIFEKDDDGSMVFVFVTDTDAFVAEFDMDMYKYLESSFTEMFGCEPDDSYLIDRQWALAYFEG